MAQIREEDAFVQLKWRDIPIERQVLGGFLLAVLVAVPAVLWRAFVASTMWGWFMEPMGAPHIGLALAIGIRLVVVMFSTLSGRPNDRPGPWMQLAIDGLVVGRWDAFFMGATRQTLVLVVPIAIMFAIARFVLLFV